VTPAQHDAARTGTDRTGPDRARLDGARLDGARLDGARRTGLDRRSALGGRRSRAAAAAAAAAAARGVDGGAEALGGGGGDGLWCACSEINLFKNCFKTNYLKKKTHPYTAAVGRAACLFFLFCFRTPGIAAELRAVITARGSRYFFSACGMGHGFGVWVLLFLMIYFNQFYFLFKKRTAAAPPPPRRRPPAPPPPPPPPPSSPPPPPPSVTDRRSPSRPELELELEGT